MRLLDARTRPVVVTVLLAAIAAVAVTRPAAAQHFYDSRVDLRFDHLYDYAEMTQAMKDLAEAYPELLELESLGQSVGGREIWLVTLNNLRTGADTSKPAMLIDGNIHGNEVQAAETVLYSIWYLTKSYGRIDRITKLVDERAFYFVPMENPDGRDMWFHEPATPNFLRGGIRPTDNDNDGLYDEDGYDDLDGDGHITRMWVKDPLGRFRRDPDDERFFVRVDNDDPPGGWTSVGSEGIDNDGDGQVNEDGPGGYDPNRNWPSDWQPNYIQGGAGEYPFSLPETRAINEFLLEHRNIAAFQSYHNSGGMILRGPGAHYVSYPRGDVRVFEELQATGEKMLPFYRAMVIHSDLYTVHGGEKNWAYEGLGIIAFTNELWTTGRMFGTTERPSAEDRRLVQDLLHFEEHLVPYREVEHPTYGTVLVGGTKKWSNRIPPPWMLQEGCHRNFAFTMHHADQMPRLAFGLHRVRRMESGTWELTVEVTNDRIIPSVTAMARTKRIGARDLLSCETGPAATVVTSGTVSSLLPTATLVAVEGPRPDRLWNDGGIPGRGSRLFRFLVAGTGSVTLEYRSEKGGTIRTQVDLEEQEPAP